MSETPKSQEDANQPPPLADVNLFTSDTALVEAVMREAGRAIETAPLETYGVRCGSTEGLALGEQANRSPPTLSTHDARGQRQDQVEYHTAYHDLMTLGAAQGLKSQAFAHVVYSQGEVHQTIEDAKGGNVVRAASLYMAAQMEAGHCCPLTMSNAAVPALMHQPELAAIWVPKILQPDYDPRFIPYFEKTSVTLGMGMTERQGGTDVRQNRTTATKTSGDFGPGEAYRLNGHKWFMSAPMSDAFLVLAQAEAGLTCFLLPRFCPDGSVNGLHFVRLKDKLGNRSNASSEVEFIEALAWRVGEEGRGIQTILEMVTYTRLDCAVASAGLMRFAVATALHHANHRTVFDKRLNEQPIMQQVLADLVLEVEAATALSFRLARSFDHQSDARAAAWQRLMTPVTKYWVCKIAPAVIAEAMEVLGGNGYVESFPLARIYREVPVNAIWEGSGNVMALDVLRVLQKHPEAVEAVMDELEAAAGDDPHLKAAHARVTACLHEPRHLELRARLLVENLAVLAAGTILRRHGDKTVADGFIGTRMGPAMRQTYGQGLEWIDAAAVVKRATPDLA